MQTFHRPRSFVFVVATIVCLTSRLQAETAPAHVRQALNKLLGDWEMKTVLDGTTTMSEFSAKWSTGDACIIYHWKGTDFLTGKQNSGTGILGWDAAKQLVVEHEIDADGSTFSATHQISKNGKWVSPTKGSSVTDGKVSHLQSLRIISWKSSDEWEVRATHHMLGGESQATIVSTIRRK